MYVSLSLCKLVHRIVHDSGPDALKEFHEHRRIFRGRNRMWMRCTELLQEMRHKLNHKYPEIADRAYDLTLDKF